MKYKFRTISIFYFITIFGILFIGIAYVVLNIFGILESTSALIVTIISILTSYFISRKLTLGKAQVTLTNKQIDFFWIKKPMLTFQNNESVNIEEIESWKYRTEFQYSYFKISNPHSIITIIRLPNWNPEKDDFDNFLFAFKKTIESQNKKRTKLIENNINKDLKKEEPKIIRDEEVDYYNSNISKILFYIYVAFGIIGVYYVYNNWNTGKTNLGIIIYGIMGCVFYINSHLRLKSKK